MKSVGEIISSNKQNDDTKSRAQMITQDKFRLPHELTSFVDFGMSHL